MKAPDERVVAEFTHQAAAFNRSPVMNADQTLARLVALLPAAAGESWLETACGPGIVARTLARRVGEVVGVDLTPAMIELAGAAATAAGVGNVRFLRGDATALPFEAARFDGAVTRFSLHHMPRPDLCVAEMARVVRPGGWVAVSDHLTEADAADRAWHRQIERLRDPSHQDCLDDDALAALGAAAGLDLVTRQIEPMVIDFAEWLQRGSGGEANRTAIGAALAARPGVPSFHVDAAGGLHLRLARFLWRRPR